MDDSSEACCRHSIRCGSRNSNWTVHPRHPNYISGYSGNIPTNIRWTGDHRPCETRDFVIPCHAPVNSLYVIHPEQYLPDGKLEPPKTQSQIPIEMRHATSRHANHPLVKVGTPACHHHHPLHTLTVHHTCEPADSAWTTSYQRAFGHVLSCGCGSTFTDYRLVPPACMNNVELKRGCTM